METLTEAQQELYDWLSDYIRQHQHAPSIRQMMHAMNLKSPAPVQSRLDHLRTKKYIDWEDGQARTIRILKPSVGGIPVLGAIAAGGTVEPYTEAPDRLDSSLLFPPNSFALRVVGDSMIEDHIANGDMVIMQPVSEPKQLKNGAIVAAMLEGGGTTLKRFYRRGDRVTLKPANPNFDPIEASADRVQVQGVLIAIWRRIEAPIKSTVASSLR